VKVVRTHRWAQFINIATGCDSPVGHGLQSCTREMSAVRVSIPELTGSEIVLIDTPGFDNDCQPDANIFKSMADWLNDMCVVKDLIRFH